jgi:hypothetical protein
MAKQSFVTGQVLTAQQVNDLQTNDFNQTVSAKTASYTLVAADKGTRITMSSTSSTTITVNTGLFEAGDTLFIQNLNTGVSTITAGTATVDTAASLALAQHEGGILYFTSAGVSTFFKSAGGASGSANWSLLNAGGTALTGAQTVTVSGISGKDKIMVLVDGASSASAGSLIYVRLNTDTGSNYYIYGGDWYNPATYAASNNNAISGSGVGFRLAFMSASATSTVSGYVLLSGCNAAGVKVMNAAGAAMAATSNNHQTYVTGGYYNSSSTISSVSVFSSSGNLDAGTVYVYTSA